MKYILNHIQSPAIENIDFTEDFVNLLVKDKNFHGVLVSAWDYLDRVDAAQSIHLAEDIPGKAGLTKLKNNITLT